MNPQAFTNALRAITGERRDYPEQRQEREPWQQALIALDEFVEVLDGLRMLPDYSVSGSPRKPATELQARIEMRVNELRELITTGEIAP